MQVIFALHLFIRVRRSVSALRSPMLADDRGFGKHSGKFKTILKICLLDCPKEEAPTKASATCY